MACSAVPNILSLGSYLEFLQIFSGKHSGLGGEEPGFGTISLSWSKLLPSSSNEWAGESSVLSCLQSCCEEPLAVKASVFANYSV